MASYDERELKHIADGIRADYPGQIPPDADPQDVITVHRQMHAPDMDPKEYLNTLRTAYGSPEHTFGEKVSALAGVAGNVAKAIPGAVASGIMAPVESVRSMQESEQAARDRQQVAAQGVQLLRDKGTLPAGTMEEQGNLAGQEQEARSRSVSQAAEGAGFYGTLPFGGAGAEAIGGAEAALGAKVAMGAAEGAAVTGGYSGIQAGTSGTLQGKGAGQIYQDITHAVLQPKELATGAVLGGALAGAHSLGSNVWEKIQGNLQAKNTAMEMAQRSAMKNEMLSRFVDEVTPSQIKLKYGSDLETAASQGAPPDVTARVILSKLTEDSPEQIQPALVDQFAQKIAKQQAADSEAAQGLAARQGAVTGAMPNANVPLPTPEPSPLPVTQGPVTPAPMVTPEPNPVDLPPSPQPPLAVERPTAQAAPSGPTTPQDASGNLVLPQEPKPFNIEMDRQPVPTPPSTAPAAVPGPVQGEAPEPHAPASLQGPVGEQQPQFTPPEKSRRVTGLESTPKFDPTQVGKSQSKVGNQLLDAAEGARKRIAARQSGALKGETGAVGDLSGKPPEDWVGQDFKDHALVLAADMFTRGLQTKQAIQDWLVQKYGESIQPHVEKLMGLAQKQVERLFTDNTNAKQKLSDLLALKDSGRHGMNWYENTADWVKEHFGQDSDMMLRFLAVTSANGQTEGGASMALKAFAQWKSGRPFTGFRGPSMVGQLEKITRGENLGDHTKIQNFYDALKGDPNAVVLDRWMMDAIGVKDRGGALREPDYKLYAHAVRDLAEQNGMSPRQFQAAVWEGARVRKAHITEAQGGKALTTKSGSARPLEQLVERNLGGKSVGQYVEDNQLNLSKMENLYNGLKDVRAGKASGHTFDPETFDEVRTPGHIVTLASTVIDRKKFYPSELLKFRNQFKGLIENEKGLDAFSPSAPKSNLTLGVYDLGNGKYSIDLNTNLGEDKDAAVKLGLKNRQFSVGHFDKSGNFTDIPTGYDPKKHGPQFVPPERTSAQPAWFKQQAARIHTFLNRKE